MLLLKDVPDTKCLTPYGYEANFKTVLLALYYTAPTNSSLQAPYSRVGAFILRDLMSKAQEVPIPKSDIPDANEYIAAHVIAQGSLSEEVQIFLSDCKYTDYMGSTVTLYDFIEGYCKFMAGKLTNVDEIFNMYYGLANALAEGRHAVTQEHT